MRPRAIVFDLDDTLYPERRFLLGGLRAVAAGVERTFGVPADAAMALMRRELSAGRRATVLQSLCATFKLDPLIIPTLVSLIHRHEPHIRMARSTRRLLRGLRRHWRLGILTNGDPGVQARKIHALALEPLVDVVIYAAEHGDGGGKPDSACFRAVASRLDVAAERCVFVGNDEVRDVDGARRAGMTAIHLHARRATTPHATHADAVVRRLIDVPFAATQLVPGELLCA
ncbi:MAG TPA: HAD family hydrolase [Vicinamibacterales bacterium]|nr:HAD family hydrolase [Vicinamibacterales bacterium]